MKTKTETTKVIFRRFTSGSDIIALFPAIAGTMRLGECLSYQHVGQHGAASVDLTHCTVPALPDEYAELAAELRRIGYILDIRRKFTAADTAARRQQIMPQDSTGRAQS